MDRIWKLLKNIMDDAGLLLECRSGDTEIRQLDNSLYTYLLVTAICCSGNLDKFRINLDWVST